MKMTSRQKIKIDRQLCFPREYRGKFIGSSGIKIDQYREQYKWESQINFDFPSKEKEHKITIQIVGDNRKHLENRLKQVTQDINQLLLQFEKQKYTTVKIALNNLSGSPRYRKNTNYHDYDWKGDMQGRKDCAAYEIVIVDHKMRQTRDPRFAGYHFENSECFNHPRDKRYREKYLFKFWQMDDMNQHADKKYRNILCVNSDWFDSTLHTIKSSLVGSFTMVPNKNIKGRSSSSDPIVYVPDLQTLDNWDNQISTLTTLKNKKDNLAFEYKNSLVKPCIQHIDSALRICTKTDYLDFDIVLSADAFAYFFSIGEIKNQKMIVKLQKVGKHSEPILFIDTTSDWHEDIQKAFRDYLLNQEVEGFGDDQRHYHVFKVDCGDYSKLKILVISNDILIPQKTSYLREDIVNKEFQKMHDQYFAHLTDEKEEEGLNNKHSNIGMTKEALQRLTSEHRSDQPFKILPYTFCQKMFGPNIRFNPKKKKFTDMKNNLLDLRRLKKRNISKNSAHNQFFKMKATNSSALIQGKYADEELLKSRNRPETNTHYRNIFSIGRHEQIDIEQAGLSDRNGQFSIRPDFDITSFVEVMRSLYLPVNMNEGSLYTIVEIDTTENTHYFENKNNEDLRVSGKVRILFVDEDYLRDKAFKSKPKPKQQRVENESTSYTAYPATFQLHD